jgi:hypothetical protein
MLKKIHEVKCEVTKTVVNQKFYFRIFYSGAVDRPPEYCYVKIDFPGFKKCMCFLGLRILESTCQPIRYIVQ